jgi:hypothetical protein
MTTFLNLLLNLLLIGSMLAFVGCSVMLTLQTNDRVETWIRVGALFAGAMIVVGAQAAGLSFAHFIVEALSSNRPGADAATIAAAGAPGVLGLGVGWYLTHSMRRHRNVAVRMMILVGMLAAAQFAEIYAAAVAKNGLAVGAAAIPNLAFAVGIILWLMLNHDVPRRQRVRTVQQLPRARQPQAPAEPTTFLLPPQP